MRYVGDVNTFVLTLFIYCLDFVEDLDIQKNICSVSTTKLSNYNK